METEPTRSAAPGPGWFPDPWQPSQLRWWDGAQWTALAANGTAPKRGDGGQGVSSGGIAGIGALVGAVASLVVSVVELVLSNGSDNPWLLLISEIPLWAGFVGAAYLASRRNGTGRMAADYGLAFPTRGDVGLGLLGGLVARLLPTLYLVLLLVAAHLNGSASDVSHNLLGVSPSGLASWTVLIVLTVVGAPIVEELFFRGLIQRVFTRRCGPVPALFITAVIFSFAHVPGEGPFAPLLLFPGAVVLGYLRLRTGKLAAGMVAHALFNGLAIVIVLVPAFR